MNPVDEDEFELVEQGSSAFDAATTRSEKRAALLTWLQGATMFAEQFMPGTGAPGKQLAAAIEALDANVILPSLFAQDGAGSTPTPAKLDAQARAVAAVRLISAKSKVAGVTMAKVRGIVCHFNGMDPDKLKSLVDHVNAGMPHVETGRYRPGQKYVPIIERVPVQTAKWIDAHELLTKYRVEHKLLDMICHDLRSDRDVLQS